MRLRSEYILTALGAVLALVPMLTVAQDATPNVTSPPGVSVRTLAAATLPVTAIPTDGAEVWIFLLTRQPGASWSHGSVAPNHRLSIIAQVSGSWAIRLDAPTVVLRADGTHETVAPGIEVVLDPGDALVHPDDTAAGAIRNPGPGLAVGLFVFVNTTIPPPGGIDWSPDYLPGQFFEFDSVGGFSKEAWAQFTQPGGPVTVTVREVTLAPGAALPPSDEQVHTDRYVESGAVSATLIRPGQTTPRPPYVAKAGGDLPWQPLRAGQVQVLSNQTDAPAVFLEITFAPAEAGAGLSVAASPEP